MKREFIRPGRGWKVLGDAKIKRLPVLIYGMAGYGKTTLAKEFLGQYKYYYYSAREGSFNPDSIPKERNDRTITLVLDNLELVKKHEDREKILSIKDRSDIWFIFISRSPLYTWLSPLYYDVGIAMINEKDLALSLEDAREYYSSKGLEISDSDMGYLLKATGATPQGLKICCSRLALGEKNYQKIIDEYQDISYEYIKSQILPSYDQELKDFMLKISLLDSFTREQAEELTKTQFFERIIEKAFETGNFLKMEKGMFTFKPIALAFFRREAELSLGSETIRNFLCEAAENCFRHRQYTSAVILFQRANNRKKMLESLTFCAATKQGKDLPPQLKDIYFQLTDEELIEYPILMATLCLLHALFMNVNKSEVLYQNLKDIAMAGKEETEELNKIRAYILWLNIVLPQRSVKEMNDTLLQIKHLPPQIVDKLPNYSMTGSLPSILNGSKDFWNLSITGEMDNIMELEQHLFRTDEYRMAAIAISHGERKYEQADDLPEALAALSRGQLQANMYPDLSFAVTGCQIRLNIIFGHLDSAKQMLGQFKKSYFEQDNNYINENIQSMKCEIALYADEEEIVDLWLKTAPTGSGFFFVRKVFSYLTAVKALIYKNELLNALIILEQLKCYTETYDRPYQHIEVLLLISITLYQAEREDWRPGFLEMLKEAYSFGIIRLIAEKCSAVLPLIQEFREEGIAATNPQWYEKLEEETKRISLIYPYYLNPPDIRAADFSSQALKILVLQGEGLSTTEIAEKLSMKMETVRYHIKQNYTKLGVNDKTTAILNARRLKLI